MGGPPREPAHEPVSELVALCLERLSLGGDDVLDEVCRDHPGHADELRRRMARLVALGLVPDGDGGEGPRAIGPFTVLGVLGQGGMGRVHLAQQTEPVRRLVAVKLVHPGMDSGAVLRRFDAERQALALLNHPGIAQVLEAGALEDGRPWFAMEYVDGRPLTEHADEHRLGLRERLGLFVQVCDAVTHAHQQGILHRDLKPSNVLVTERLGRPLVKVIDFGLAKVLDEAAGAGDLTQAGQIVGTPAYMSPEQAGAIEHPTDLRTDVYALGVLLYELLVGALPFETSQAGARGVRAMQHLLRDETATPPSRRVTAVDPDVAAARGLAPRAMRRAFEQDLDWIVGKALARDPAARYASVSELAADVRRHLRDEPVLAGPPSTAYRLSRLVRRHRREVAVGALGLLAVLVAFVVIVVQATRLSRELDNFDVLARGLELRELADRARDELWPAVPARAGAMAAWMEDARAQLAERGMLEDLLARLRGRARAAPGGGLAFDSPREAYLHEQLTALLGALDAFDAPDGWLARVEARHAWATTLVRRTIEDEREAWDAAIASIADARRCPAYGGLEITPQAGLVPLGRDALSGLWEFLYATPDGRRPARVDDRWVVEPSTSLVLVLVPGGTVRQGAQDDDPRFGAYLDEIARAERFGRRVELAPFFVSKYEMTQAQWERATGDNPSYYAPGHPAVADATHPVEQVSWAAADEVLRRLGLRLPTGAQWEYAARAGLASPWWAGTAAGPVLGCVNVADRNALAAMGREAGIDDFDEDYDDGWAAHAPVDALAPNPFGLHHVIGNLWEWCADLAYDYDRVEPRPGDGLQVPIFDEPGPDRPRELRGGSFLSTYRKARSTFRFYQTRDSANFVFGVRPARPLRPVPTAFGDTP